MKIKSIISMYLAAAMLFAAGCGNVLTSEPVDETAERDAIELIKATVSMPDVVTEAVSYRDIYVTDIYDGSVYPGIKEYSFESSQSIVSFGKKLGDEVIPGDILVYADDEKLLEQIENCRERVDNLKENYQKFVEENNKAIAAARDWMAYYADILDDMQEIKPTDTSAADYAKRLAIWEEQNAKWQGNYNIQEYNVMVAEEEMRQRTELYHLDYEHYNAKLQKMLTQHRETRIVADAAGTVVAVSDDGYKTKGTSVIAISCDDEKYIKTKYIYNVDIRYNAKDVYAFADGKRFEVTFVSDGNKDTSTFILHDDANELESGDFVNIVLVKKASRENVLTVPSSAIYGTAAERYVYKVENNKAEKTIVKCGSTDGIYTEITAGLNEGDLVQISKPLTEQPVNTAVLAPIEKVTTEFSRNVEIEHLDSASLKNTLTGVDVYFLEYLVEKNTYVKAGTPMVSVRVDGDPYVVIELEREIQRDRERLIEDKIASKPEDMSEDAAKAFEEQLEKNREVIAEKEERLAELRKAYSTTTLDAPADGYVPELQWMQADTLLASNQTLGTILCIGDIYLTVDDSRDMLRYNQPMVVFLRGARNVYEAKVAQIGDRALSEDLTTGNVERLIFTDEQAMLSFQEEYYGARQRYVSTLAEIILMQNVLTVPEHAVVKKDNATYVNVLREDGTIVLKSFVGTRYNNKGDYWVIDGLTEGMTICWE